VLQTKFSILISDNLESFLPQIILNIDIEITAIFCYFFTIKSNHFKEVTMSEENGLAKGLFIGFVAGGVIGGLVALLYAPKSGKEFRADLKQRKDELMDDAEEYMDIAKHKAEDIINEGKKRSEELISDAKKRAGSLLEDANSILNVAKEKTSSTYEQAKARVAEESGKVKDAIKAGVEAYKEERTKSN